MEYLFSYGTLQFQKVQLETFNRLLVGESDSLQDYTLKDLEIKDPEVLKTSEKSIHPIAVQKQGGLIRGMVFEISKEELALCDLYEVSDYKRIELKLTSGKHAWVYVNAA